MKKLQLFLITLLMLLGASAMRAAEAYAVLDGSTLTFYYDNNKASRTGTKFSMNKAGYAPNWTQNTYPTKITSVVFDSSFSGATPATCMGWFNGLTNLKTITGIKNLNTSSATEMRMMFYNCSSLTTLDLSGFNTSNVTTMKSMFYGCSSLSSLNISGFNTTKVTDMSMMFYECGKLSSVDVSGFSTAKVTDLSRMFYNCNNLTSLNISSFTLTSSQSSDYMFYKAGLKSFTIPATANVLNANACMSVGSQSAPCALNYPSGFTPDKDKTGSGWYMWKTGYFKDGTTPTPSTTEAYAVLSGSTLTFYYDAKKASRSGTKYSLNTGTAAPGWNSSAASVTKVVFDSSFENASPTSCYQWFCNMGNLTDIMGIEYLKTSKVTNMNSMFNGCAKLTSLDLSTFETQNVTTMYRMFYNCSALKDLQLYNMVMGLGEYEEYSTTFTTDKVTNMQEMFYGCKNLKELVLADFKVSSSTNTKNMLKGCSSLGLLYFDQDMGALDASACSGVGTATKPCSLENPRYLPEPDQITPTYMLWKSGYFKDGLRTISIYLQGDVMTFDYDLAYLPGYEYFTCEINTGSNDPDWYDKINTKVAKVVITENFRYVCPTSTHSWFRSMSKLTQIEGLENLNTENVTDMGYMFSGDTKLTALDLSTFTFNASGNTKLMMNGCSGLKTLTVPSTAGNLAADACKGVGTASAPITLNYPSGFTPEKTSTGDGYFVWKSGYFKDTTTPTATEAYAVFSGSTLTFYYDAKKSSRSGTKYSLNTGTAAPGWNSSAASVTKVVFDSSFENASPTSCYQWFCNMGNLTDIMGIEYLKTSKVTNMNSMFNGCAKLTSLDLSTFETQNVTTMYRMFYNCSALKDLQLYNMVMGLGEYEEYSTTFTTDKVTNMQEMFYGCKNLKELVLAEFKVSSSTNTKNMLKSCSSLEMLYFDQDMGALDASACSGVGTSTKPCSLENPHSLPEPDQITPTYMLWKSGYFKDGLRMIRIYLVDNVMTFDYDLAYLPGYEYFTYELNTGGNNPDWYDKINTKVAKVEITENFRYVCPTSTHSWFCSMSKLTQIEGLENINTEYVTDMANMFSGCTKLTSLDLSKFTFSSSSNTKLMMNGCSGLKMLTVPSTAGNLAADACKGVGTASAPITLNYPSGFTPEKTSTGNGYFVWKSGYFKDTTTPTPTGEMYAVLDGSTLTFYYDNNKSSRTGTKFSMNKVGNAPNWTQNGNATKIKSVVFDSSFSNARPLTCIGWFNGMSNLTSITGINNLNTSSATEMRMMFYNCSSLTSVDVSGFITDNVTTMKSMFYSCSNLTGLDVSKFNTAKVTDMSMMFYECSKLSWLNVSKFNTAKVTDLSRMFYDCKSLTNLDISSFTLTSSQSSDYMLYNVGLKTLAIPATANVLNANACMGVGSQSAPCTLIHPSSFTPDKDKTGSGWYMWKTGYFKSVTRYLGDVNLDGKIDVTDAMCIVDYVLSKPLSVFAAYNANLNGDEKIDITDAMMIVDIVLNKPSSAPAATELSSSDLVYVTGNGGELDLHLKGSSTYKAAEMTLSLPEGCSLDEAEMNPLRSAGHDLLVNDLGGGVYRIVVLGVNSREFSQNGTALIHFSVDGDHRDDFRVSDVVMTSTDLESVAIGCVPGIVTGIDGLSNDGSSDGEWYNLQGQRVTSPQRGIYIRNGKKYMVK